MEALAPPPRISGTARTAGSAHAFLPLAAAVATVVIVALAMLGRWRLARVLVFVGAGVIVISLAIDLPKGLDEGSTAIEFEGAQARLLGAFWVQILCGFVIAICGPLLARALEPAGDRRPRPRTAPRALAGGRGQDRRPWRAGGERMSDAPAPTGRRIERLLPIACVVAAGLLIASELMTTFEFTPPGGEALSSQSAGDRHSYAQIVLGVFAIAALVVAIVNGSKPAATAVAVCGVIALLIFLAPRPPGRQQRRHLSTAGRLRTPRPSPRRASGCS